ncbi:MAG: hypothetical protein D3X82_16970 [Candidatus Leucobacter sulfamidivorax]|nr:hypothetical protein [Candidatus Leucobacter sulfamidivorax]
MGERVEVWLGEQGRPARLVHGGARWRVIDRPTPLTEEPDWIPPEITHPPAQLVGWRCTVRREIDREVIVVDLRTGDDGWVVARTYEG